MSARRFVAKRVLPVLSIVVALGLAARLLTPVSTVAEEAKAWKIAEPMGKAAFPHALHVEENEIECATCHVGTAEPEREVASPSADACSDCHDEADVEQFFPVGSYHGADFRHRHAMEATVTGARCVTCHEGSETCAMCHDGEEMDFPGHPRSWIFLHSIEARHGQVECSACHSLETFCSDCHLQERVEPSSHKMGGWTRGIIHSSEARRDPMFCASCHAGKEPVCLECHDTR